MESAAAGPSESMDHLLGEFPPTRFAFGYGSAVFSQSGYSVEDTASAMTDLVFAVDDPAEWHRENIAANRAHYSGLAALGAPAVAAIQEDYGGRIYYNTHAVVRGRLIKYGVISSAAIRDDLESWSSLYVSGRMHKPVRVLRGDASLQPAVERNLRSALAASLLLLPSRFDELRLLDAICRLSYAGDVRMGVGESWHKVDNIVAGQLARLRQLYAAPLAADAAIVGPERLATAPSGAAVSTMLQDTELPARQRLLGALPLCAQAGTLAHLAAAGYGAAGSAASAAAVPARLAEATGLLWSRSAGALEANERLAASVHHSLASIVRRASAAQTIKGMLSAGALRSVVYALAKVSKRIRATAPARPGST